MRGEDYKLACGDRVDNMASISILQASVLQTMKHMLRLHSIYKNICPLPPKVRAQLNVDLLGIIYFNSWAGRCGEWKGLSLVDLLEQLEKHPDFVVLRKVKTRKSYGVAVKWLAPGTQVAIKLYAEMPRGEDDKFFLVPSQPGAKEVSFSSALNTWGYRSVEGGYESPQVTLVRKLFHNRALDEERRDTVVEAIKSADKHSKEMAAHYNAQSLIKQAAHSKGIFEGVMGSAVEWPTEENQLEDDLEAVMDDDGDGGADSAKDDSESENAISETEGGPGGEEHRIVYAEPSIVDGDKTEPVAKLADDETTEPVAKRIRVEKAASSGHRASHKDNSHPIFLPKHKDWIAEERNKVFQLSNSLPAVFVKDWYSRGIAEGHLPPQCTYEQVRHVARNHQVGDC